MIIALLFQLMPSTYDYADDFQSQKQDSQAFFSSKIINTDIIYTGERNQRTSIQKIQINSTPAYIPQVFIEDICATSFTFQGVDLDHRKIIRQSVPHYFNGSKYKGNIFAI